MKLPQSSPNGPIVEMAAEKDVLRIWE